VKIRTGTDRQHVNGTAIAAIAARAGVQAIAVHGRTRADFYEGEAEYETIRAICAEAHIPVFANGDIDSAAKALAVIRHTAAAGVMIGRAAHGAPWIFRDVNAALEGREAPAPLTRRARRDLILRHLGMLYEFHGETAGVRIARKHLGWYCAGDPTTQSARAALMAAETTAEQFARARECFDAWAAMPVADAH
jgi:tRNA-dihydrouridine synthase B